jgi:signal peptidase II
MILLGTAALTLMADLTSKALVVKDLPLNIPHSPPLPFLEPIFSLTYTTNTGAAFGLFADRGMLFILIAFAVVAAIVFYYRYLPEGYPWVRLALGLQLGGALGNLIDRLRQGYVIDFIDLNFWPLKNWPIFNIADSAIVVGVSLLAILMLFEDMEMQDQVEPSESEATRQTGASL